MALGVAPDSGWVVLTNSAAALSPGVSVLVPRGVAIIADIAFSIGNRSTITHKANNVTDGFPIAANTVFEFPPGMMTNGTSTDLQYIYVIGSGSGNAWIIYPKA